MERTTVVSLWVGYNNNEIHADMIYICIGLRRIFLNIEHNSHGRHFMQDHVRVIAIQIINFKLSLKYDSTPFNRKMNYVIMSHYYIIQFLNMLIFSQDPLPIVSNELLPKHSVHALRVHDRVLLNDLLHVEVGRQLRQNVGGQVEACLGGTLAT